MVLFKGSLHNNLRLIPPSRVSLIEHVKRASYQGGWIWKHCVDDPDLPEPSNCGWESFNGRYKPRWQIITNSTDEEMVTVICICKSAKCQRCNCKQGLECLPFCKCQQKCVE